MGIKLVAFKDGSFGVRSRGKRGDFGLCFVELERAEIKWRSLEEEQFTYRCKGTREQALAVYDRLTDYGTPVKPR